MTREELRQLIRRKLVSHYQAKQSSYNKIVYDVTSDRLDHSEEAVPLNYDLVDSIAEALAEVLYDFFQQK